MRKKSLSIFLLVVMLFSIAALPASAATPNNSDSVKSVAIFYFRYWPKTLTVQVGDTVVWHNLSQVLHTADGDNKEWDSGELEPGQAFSFVAATAGTFTYHCDIHEFMHGTLVVQP